MWPDARTGEGVRPSTSSEVAIISAESPPDVLPLPIAAPPEVTSLPQIGTLNFTNSAKPHIGHKFVTVNNAIHVDEVVQGQCLGLQVTSSVRTRRLRGAVAVFVAWVLVLACGLIIYFFSSAFTTKYRIDIDVPCWQYVWSVVRSSSRAERLACLTALVVVAICAGVAVYFTMFHNNNSDEPDIAPSIWYLKREEWLAQPYNGTEVDNIFNPLRLVVIQHTAGNQCHRFSQCAAELRNLQSYFISDKDRDIPYNFLIGNDGRAYEGRGWNKIGAHTARYNGCSVGIGFMGDYRSVKVTDLQQTRLHMLLAEGVKLGYLHPEYKVVAAMDIRDTVSPGTNLYEAMQNWQHYDHKKLFKDINCTLINDMPFP